MKKYLFIIKTEIMSNFQYIWNVLFGFVGYAIILFILFNLWKYLYSDPSQLINGYNMNQMTWYVIITEILWSTLGGRKLCRKISNDVKSGNIAYNINKPYDYIGYSLSTFFIEDSGPFYWLYSKFILILGTIFPIEYFPKVMQGFLNYSPVYVVSYGPAKLFVDFSYSRALSIIIAQVVYIIVVSLIANIIYRKGVKRINVNGG